MNEENEFSQAQLVAFAKTYANLCGDLDGFAALCAKEVHESGEPAFWLTTKKSVDGPKSFPVALEMRGYDERKRESFVVACMDITRPEYRPNPHGFKGNHLVVALLEDVKERLQSLVPEGIGVLTSQSAWRSLIHGAGYAELKSQRALENMLPPSVAPSVKKSRL